ncbi:MAG: hypothetical protein A2293_10875 [Elusimicrobia bacterium RIFOXYB2_FULL_49_7]|nr:MAG: hypothetical protein A2293_10875 [Elusimicrobia bacterium RIFOXYB2_FULL_49_7]
MSELFWRILFAVVAIPVSIFAVMAGGQITRGFCTLFLLVGGIEFYFMTRRKGTPVFLPALLMGITVFCFRNSVVFANVEGWLFPVLWAALFLLVVREVAEADIENVLSRAGGTFLGIFYIGFLGSFLISITEHPAHPQMVRLGLLTLLLAVWGSDSLAFFVGKAFGKHPLHPRLSPKKTVEGLIGSIMGSMIGVLIGRSFFEPHFPSLSGALVVGLAIGIFGQAGDLFESLLKRSCGVKDSSSLFPGHGGVLDRIDALLFCAPIYYYLLLVLK